jgi:LysR family transcriptional regulator, hydrogen peroxide-inducible genes activator
MDKKINFTLTQMEYVLAVFRYGHFAKAAKACFVTQPTLSMQIQKLEESIGAVIFDRSKKPILLTPLGKKIIESMQKILDETKTFESLVQSELSNAVEGQLTLGVIPTIAPYLLPRFFSKLSKKYPLLHLKIHEMQTSRIIEALSTDEIDLGILAIPLKIPKILETPLFHETFSVLCHKKHELAARKRISYGNLHGNDIWLLEEGHCLRHQVMDVCSMRGSLKRNIEFESGSLETLKNLVNSFGGFTLLPQLATDTKGSNTVIIEFEKPIPSRQVGFAHRREHHKVKLISALREVILESIPEEMKSLNTKHLDILPVE